MATLLVEPGREAAFHQERRPTGEQCALTIERTVTYADGGRVRYFSYSRSSRRKYHT